MGEKWRRGDGGGRQEAGWRIGLLASQAPLEEHTTFTYYCLVERERLGVAEGNELALLVNAGVDAQGLELRARPPVEQAAWSLIVRPFSSNANPTVSQNKK